MNTATSTPTPIVADQLKDYTVREEINGDVQISNELIRLLSDQLYQSPLKAIEELVVNAYDAYATECRIFVPAPAQQADIEYPHAIVIADNGSGMSESELIDLWHIGHSTKRDPTGSGKTDRKMIGKFGIGKLATYSVGRRLTYISKKNGKTLALNINFDDFSSSPTGKAKPIPLTILRITEWDKFTTSDAFKRAASAAGLDEAFFAHPTWTVSIIEHLKDKAKEIKIGRLEWVLRTAMPMAATFKLFLNKKQVKRSKDDFKFRLTIDIKDLPESRLDNLKKATGHTWQIKNNKLFSPDFPEGIAGKALVADRSLYGQKSDDIARSHGFFIRVRGRLINQIDPYFGVVPSYEIWNNFRADIEADDLDQIITSNREEVMASSQKEALERVLTELFNEARAKHHELLRTEDQKEHHKKEGERAFVAPRLVEHPIADALVSTSTQPTQPSNWFYLTIKPGTAIPSIIEKLYNEPRSRYQYAYEKRGRNERIAEFDPTNSTFTINADHEFVQEHGDEGRSRLLLEDVVTAELMLEIYLRRSGVEPSVINDVLNTRDILLRSLAKERRFSLAALAATLRDSAGNERDLEMTLVACARALGFVANHISGAGDPDGLARFQDYPNGEIIITLEAKSSQDIPSLSAIDFAGLASHMQHHGAKGCLLVAPAYPGNTKEDNEAALRAKQQRVSCWTVEQLARIVEAAESRHITAKTIFEILLNYFSPEDVTKKINEVLASPAWNQQSLYLAILQVLRDLEMTAQDSVRNIGMVLGVLATKPALKTVKQAEVVKAVSELAGASKGGMTFRNDPAGTIIIHVNIDEIERRVSGLTKMAGPARKPSLFSKT